MFNVKLDSLSLEKKPYPHLIFENFVNENLAKKCQNEILEIKDEEWDRYDNPFEGKYTFRNKNNILKIVKNYLIN